MSEPTEASAEPVPNDAGLDDAVTPDIAPPESVPPISAEELVDGDHPAPEESGEPVDPSPANPPGELEERRYPSTIGGAFYLLVLAVTITGLCVVTFGDWRVGIRIMGGALLFGAAIRAVLSPRDAGMLAVRHRALDMALLVGLGSALIFLASSIPDQPGL